MQSSPESYAALCPATPVPPKDAARFANSMRRHAPSSTANAHASPKRPPSSAASACAALATPLSLDTPPPTPPTTIISSAPPYPDRSTVAWCARGGGASAPSATATTSTRTLPSPPLPPDTSTFSTVFVNLSVDVSATNMARSLTLAVFFSGRLSLLSRFLFAFFGFGFSLTSSADNSHPPNSSTQPVENETAVCAARAATPGNDVTLPPPESPAAHKSSGTRGGAKMQTSVKYRTSLPPAAALAATIPPESTTEPSRRLQPACRYRRHHSPLCSSTTSPRRTDADFLPSPPPHPPRSTANAVKFPSPAKSVAATPPESATHSCR
eukprot:Rhum_TRINITY_DN5012_c0_g1::Rhum_TRINITY_DN5012_c0_g1_i1::g.16321::m.16321